MATVKLDRERTLLFNVSVARRFKQAYGIPLYQTRLIRDGGLEMLDADCLCNLLAEGLRHEWPKVSVKDIEDLLDKHLAQGNTLDAIHEALGDAFKESGLFADLNAKKDAEGKAPGPPPTS